MSIFRRLHPILLATWLLTGAYASLLVASYSSLGIGPTLSDIFLRARDFRIFPGWLPNNLLSASFLWWLFVAATLALLSAATRALAKYLGEKDYSGTALHWFFTSRRNLATILVLLLSSITGLAFPTALMAGFLIALFGIGISTQKELMRGESIRWSFATAARALFRALLIAVICISLVAVDVAERHFLAELQAGVSTVISIALYFFQLALGGLLLGVAVFGFKTVNERGTLQRFASSKYLFAWVRLHYRLALIWLWVIAPIAPMATFMWFVLPSLKLRAQTDAQPLAWPVEWFAAISDRVVGYGALALLPFVAFVYVVVKAKMLVYMEGDFENNSRRTS